MAAALAAVLLAGCGVLPEGRTFSAGDVTVVDTTNLVTEVREGAPPRPGSSRAEPLVASPETLRAISVYWTGSSCVEGWTLRLSGYGLKLVIEPGGERRACDAVAVSKAVTLWLNRVIAAESFDVSLARSP